LALLESRPDEDEARGAGDLERGGSASSFRALSPGVQAAVDYDSGRVYLLAWLRWLAIGLPR